MEVNRLDDALRVLNEMKRYRVRTNSTSVDLRKTILEKLEATNPENVAVEEVEEIRTDAYEEDLIGENDDDDDEEEEGDEEDYISDDDDSKSKAATLADVL